jgi:glycosyltransferase 2 family protein
MTTPQTQSMPPAEPRISVRRAIRLGVYALLIAVVFYYVGRALLACFREIDFATVSPNYLFVALSLACLCGLRLFFAGMICNTLLKSFGSGIGYLRSSAIIWSSSMGRYIPGKMVAITGALVMLARAGVRLPVALAALFLSTALSILVALIIAAPIFLRPAVRQQLPWVWVPAALVVAGGLLCLYPTVFAGLCNLALRILRRPPLPAALRFRPFLLAVGLIALRCAVLALGMWLAARAIVPVGLSDYPLVLTSVALATVSGFLAVFVPAGLGVQEAIYLLTLGPLLGPEVGLVALIFRLLQVLADALVGLAGLYLLRGWPAKIAPAAEAQPAVT